MPDANRRTRLDDAFLRLVATEDARATEGPSLTRLTEAAEHEGVFLRRVATRALGRLEDPVLVPSIEPRLADGDAAVRATAANAVAQAYHTSSGEDALPILLDRLAVEGDAVVRGAIARSLGRLRLSEDSRETVIETLVAISSDGDEDAPTETLLGVVLGLEAISRVTRSSLGPRATTRLTELTGYFGAGPGDEAAQRTRALAVQALGQSGTMTPGVVTRAYQDQYAPQVRALATRFVGLLPEGQRPEMIRRAIAMPSVPVIMEALGYLATQPRDARNCSYLFAAAQRPPPDVVFVIPAAVRLHAIDALAQPCPDRTQQRRLLREVSQELLSGSGSWQPAAHALVSLANLSPRDAALELAEFAAHPSPFVRAYAARAAGILRNRIALRALSDDRSANVRTVAIDALFALDGHGIDGILLAQLADDDPQLLMTTARLLEGTPDRTRAAGSLMSAFERISDAERETWRDSRRALLARLGDVGDERLVERLEPFLGDYDPQVADDVAGILRRWTGRTVSPNPQRLPRAPLPTAEELRRMDGASVLLHMEGDDVIEIDLHPYLSPTNTFRFYRLVQEGYFDGLTFHRWAPSFVIQGGSPGANEYQGDAAFSRDEVGLLSHWRGTVGISTRGHDTGDGQIFVNLMHNVRLDHTYTIVGTVTEGLEVVDRVLEGSIIERAEIRLAN